MTLNVCSAACNNCDMHLIIVEQEARLDGMSDSNLG